MARVNEAVLKSAILAQLLDYQGEEIAVDDLVQDLINAGFFRAYIDELIWDLFSEKQGVVLCGEPFGTKVMMPESFQPPEELVAAHRTVEEEARRRLSEFLPMFFELATSPG